MGCCIWSWPTLMARFLSRYKQLGAAKKCGSEHMNGDGVKEELSQFLVDRFGALEELLFIESEHSSFFERGRLGLGEGGAEAHHLFFTQMQAKNSNFFNAIDLDEEGCVRNVFWADARSRAAYQYYSDAVALDTTYVTSKYDLPLATFVGVNHHGQPVLLGCSSLSDETTETSVWLLKAWIACMLALTSDHCKGILSAVSELFLGIHHCLCLWQIMKRIPEKLGGLERFLPSDSKHDDTRPKMKPCLHRTTKLNQNINQSVGKIVAPEIENEMQWRGWPPQTKVTGRDFSWNIEGRSKPMGLSNW